MRRGFSISLVLLFLLAPLASWLPGIDESSLPMCCRRHGSHHCAASSDDSGGSGPGTVVMAAAHCPRYSAAGPATLAAFLLPPAPALAIAQERPAPSLPILQIHRASLRTAADRGPPSAC
jgi:hypothetical protein